MKSDIGAGLRILVISDHFVPENSSATQRIVSWARHWPAAGAAVDLITTRKHPVNDGPLTKDGWETRTNLGLHEVLYWPAALYELARQRAAAQAPVGARRSTPRGIEILGTLKRGLIELQKVSPHFLNSRTLFGVSGAARALGLSRAKTYDVIVASSPLPQCHVVGWAASIASGTPLVLDYRDQWTSPPAHGLRAAARIPERALEELLVRHAAAIVTVSTGEARTFERAFHRKAHVIANGFEPGDMPGGDENGAPKAPGAPVRLGYFGTFHLPNSSPEPLLTALRRLVDGGMSRTAIAVDFFGPKNDPVLAMIDRYGVGDIVRMHGSLPRAEALREQRACDALLLFDWNDEAREGIMTGKIFEYAASGRKTLVIGGNGDTVAARFLEDNGFGTSFRRDDAAIAAWLVNATTDGVLPTDSRSAGVLARHERSALARDYLALLREVVDSRPRRL